MRSVPRVVLNASILLAPQAGIGRYVGELSRALQQRTDVHLSFTYGLRHGPQLPAQGLSHYSLLRDLAKRLLPSPYQAKRWVERRTLRRALDEQNADLYHEPSLWPQRVDRPMVFTLHDLTHVHYPQTQPADRLRAIEKSLDHALGNARRILCVSESTAQQAMQHYSLNRERLCVTPLGVSAHFRPCSADQSLPTLQPLGLRHRKFLLCVGTLEPRKNLELVFQAVQHLPSSFLEHYPLVLAGARGWGEIPLSLAQLERKGHLIRTGYLEREPLHLLMGSARTLLFPSLYEGFGLPILEAMASGTPVITSNCSSMPEVGGEAAVYIDPTQPEQLAEAILRLHEDDALWATLQLAGLKRAGEFSWERTAELTMSAYRAALS